jgi:hypothetical protein
MTWGAWLILAVALAAVVTLVLQAVGRAHRLDRLHRRIGAAQVGLRSALDRRAAVAQRVAAAPTPRAPPAHELRSAADAALAAGLDRERRETAENELTRRLAAVDRGGLDPSVLAELVEAEQLVVLARRVHNDAVRDTLVLRSRRMVRWLRLAGTAPAPGYFEIADPEPAPSRVIRRAAVAPPR